MTMAVTNRTADTLQHAMGDLGFEVVGRVDLPAREPRRAPVPRGLSPRLRQALERAHPEGLWAHQAQALEAFLDGVDLGIATPTASGKSLVFMAAAGHVLLEERGARVVVLYPARALVKDQLAKWNALLGPLGIEAGIVDGSVRVEQREEVLRRCGVLLMTPDVVHAWLMSRLDTPQVRQLLRSLRLLVLDEAHVYEGAFGTQSAYLFRRLAAVAARFRLVCSTATLEAPADFLQTLTGRRVRVLGPEDDGAPSAGKSVLHARCTGDDGFEAGVRLLGALARRPAGRFLAFADSRRAVEQQVAALRRHERAGEEEAEEDDAPPSAVPLRERVLPFRAGYEKEDREAIQRALQDGTLAGVVSTSALELGLDIGDIDVVVMLGVPPGMKAFWQRLGRAGRRAPGTCVLVDDRGLLDAEEGAGLEAWLARPLEPSWLYLDNRYIQYVQALCAAQEVRQARLGQEQALAAYEGLPASFRGFLSGELQPQGVLPGELYALKQRAQAGPHREFPLRCGTEASFQVSAYDRTPLGTLTWPQVLREAYPGAAYYYLGRPYRVQQLVYRRGQVGVRPERRLTTRPVSQVMVFPDFASGVHGLWRSEDAFVAEVDLQVSERVTGFVEQRGKVRETHEYRPGSPWAQAPLTRFFETTGVCLFLPEAELLDAEVGALLLEAFTTSFGVQPSDVGQGVFHASASPLGPLKARGLCIYDTTHGSLRLTQRLAEALPQVARRAAELAAVREDAALAARLARLAERVKGLTPAPAEGEASGTRVQAEDGWVDVVAPGERAMAVGEGSPREVTVLRCRYTPNGLVYDLEPPQPGVRWSKPVADVHPLHGTTRTLRVNIVTGEGMG